MSPIKVSDLHSAGSHLLSDSESFIDHLSDSELDNTTGGVIDGGCIPSFPFSFPTDPYPDPDPFP